MGIDKCPVECLRCNFSFESIFIFPGVPLGRVDEDMLPENFFANLHLDMDIEGMVSYHPGKEYEFFNNCKLDIVFHSDEIEFLIIDK